MSKHIMVIDDSPTIRLSVELALKQLGFEITQAEDGRDALKKIDEIKNRGGELKLCISDINMPVMNGIEFIKELKKTDKYTPVVVLTTESEREKIQNGRDAGASGWVIKPFQAEDLVGVVQRFVK